ncbi:hypothetical protein RND81_09G006600 [Saponaria officinalis]|uniref:F-box domain-containing protein n=1 Tax=Saponaria officinalis TaxID=3572 RepID=A0AAW1IGH2_SAPOF
MDVIHQSEEKSESVTLNIPEEIIHYDILTRVPVKSLLRFKSVCKYWYTLINSSTFINIHQKYCVESRSQDYSSEFFIVSNEYGSNTCELTYIDAHNFTSVRNFKIEDANNRNYFNIVGSCNGFICLKLTNYYSGFKLCNPLTKEFRNIIDHPRYNNGTRLKDTDYLQRYGFGYDFVRRDYKIVVVTCYRKYSYSPLFGRGVVQVYSTRTNSWKKTDEFSPNLFLMGNGLAINNMLHWNVVLGEKDDSNKHDILTFDLHTEKLGRISYSIKLKNELALGLMVGLMVSNGRLCTITKHLTKDGRIGFWTMNKYGVSESWMKLYEFEGGEVCCFDLVNVIYGSRMNFEEVLVTKHVKVDELVWYNLKDKSIRRLGIRRSRTYYADEWACIGSLAPLPSNC